MTNDAFFSVAEDQIISQSVVDISIATLYKGPFIKFLALLWQMSPWHRVCICRCYSEWHISLLIFLVTDSYSYENLTLSLYKVLLFATGSSGPGKSTSCLHIVIIVSGDGEYQKQHVINSNYDY